MMGNRSIVGRLRSLARVEHDDLSIGQEAADHIEAQANRIERLEADVDWLDKKIGSFGDVDDGRSQIMRLQAACHVLCHRDHLATQLESEHAAQAKRIEELEIVVAALSADLAAAKAEATKEKRDV